jgi:hypothetical protein
MGDLMVVHTYFQSTLQRNLDLYIHRKGIARHSPNFHIHVSVGDLYIPTFGPPIFLQQNRLTDQRNMNVGIGTVAAQFLS